MSQLKRKCWILRRYAPQNDRTRVYEMDSYHILLECYLSINPEAIQPSTIFFCSSSFNRVLRRFALACTVS